jgi:hypothetical protein
VIRCRVDDVSAVLGAIAVPPGLRISAVQAISWESGADAFFGILLSDDEGETVTRVVRRGRDGVTEVDPAEFPHLRFAEPDPVDPGPDLRELLPGIRRSFGADAPIRSLAVTPGPGGGNVVLVKEDDRYVAVSLSILDLISEPK